MRLWVGVAMSVFGLVAAEASSQRRESATGPRNDCEPTYIDLKSPGSMQISGKSVLDYSVALVGCRGEIDRLTTAEIGRAHRAMGKYREESCIGFAGAVHGGPDRWSVAAILNSAIGRDVISDVFVYQANVLDCYLE